MSLAVELSVVCAIEDPDNGIHGFQLPRAPDAQAPHARLCVPGPLPVHWTLTTWQTETEGANRSESERASDPGSFRWYARVARGASGIVTALPPLRVTVRVRWPRSRPRCSMSAPVPSETRSPLARLIPPGPRRHPAARRRHQQLPSSPGAPASTRSAKPCARAPASTSHQMFMLNRIREPG
jgi:hypothetical protein